MDTAALTRLSKADSDPCSCWRRPLSAPMVAQGLSMASRYGPAPAPAILALREGPAVRHLRTAAEGPGLAAATGAALMRAQAVKSDFSPIRGLKNMTSSALASLGRAQQQVCAVVFHAGVECTKTSLANSGNQHKRLDDKRFYFAKQSLYSNKYNCKLD